MIYTPVSPAAFRILIEMAQEVREARSIPILDLYLMWSDHLSEQQFRKALHYLVRSGVVIWTPGDILVWAPPTFARVKEIRSIQAEEALASFPDDTRVLDGMGEVRSANETRR
jgi:hypothetical protein